MFFLLLSPKSFNRPHYCYLISTCGHMLCFIKVTSPQNTKRIIVSQHDYCHFNILIYICIFFLFPDEYMDASSRPSGGTTRGIDNPIYPKDSAAKPKGIPSKPERSERSAPIYGNTGMSTFSNREVNINTASEEVSYQNFNKTYDGVMPGDGRKSEAYATLGEEGTYYQM